MEESSAAVLSRLMQKVQAFDALFETQNQLEADLKRVAEMRADSSTMTEAAKEVDAPTEGPLVAPSAPGTAVSIADDAGERWDWSEHGWEDDDWYASEDTRWQCDGARPVENEEKTAAQKPAKRQKTWRDFMSLGEETTAAEQTVEETTAAEKTSVEDKGDGPPERLYRAGRYSWWHAARVRAKENLPDWKFSVWIRMNKKVENSLFVEKPVM